jgi:hypothetical protein
VIPFPDGSKVIITAYMDEEGKSGGGQMVDYNLTPVKDGKDMRKSSIKPFGWFKKKKDDLPGPSGDRKQSVEGDEYMRLRAKNGSGDFGGFKGMFRRGSTITVTCSVRD